MPEFHEEETAIGLDPGTHSGVVQHVTVLNAQMDLLRGNAQNSAAQLDEHSEEEVRMSAATAQAASREVRSRIIYDSRNTGARILKHSFVKEIAKLEQKELGAVFQRSKTSRTLWAKRKLLQYHQGLLCPPLRLTHGPNA